MYLVKKKILWLLGYTVSSDSYLVMCLLSHLYYKANVNHFKLLFLKRVFFSFLFFKFLFFRNKQGTVVWSIVILCCYFRKLKFRGKRYIKSNSLYLFEFVLDVVSWLMAHAFFWKYFYCKVFFLRVSFIRMICSCDM